MSKQRIVVVGNGMVGHKFIDTLITDESVDYDIITFSEESRLAYDRVQLSGFFSGKTAQDLALTDAAYYQKNGINFVLNDKVTQLDSANNQVVTASGRVESYDKLILATG
ncbi:MAG: FAD-dependent oxidoreductase, partial [Psychromonas sp.]